MPSFKCYLDVKYINRHLFHRLFEKLMTRGRFALSRYENAKNLQQTPEKSSVLFQFTLHTWLKVGWWEILNRQKVTFPEPKFYPCVGWVVTKGSNTFCNIRKKYSLGLWRHLRHPTESDQFQMWVRTLFLEALSLILSSNWSLMVKIFTCHGRFNQR